MYFFSFEITVVTNDWTAQPGLYWPIQQQPEYLPFYSSFSQFYQSGDHSINHFTLVTTLT
jgi:hypothetical protein